MSPSLCWELASAHIVNGTFLSLGGEDPTSKLVGGRTRTLSAELMFIAITHNVSSRWSGLSPSPNNRLSRIVESEACNT